MALNKHDVKADQSSAQFEWKTMGNIPQPKRFVNASDLSHPHEVLASARQGTGVILDGDFHSARQLLQSLRKKLTPAPKPLLGERANLAEQFHIQRLQQTQIHQVLHKLCVDIRPDHSLTLRKAPNVIDALRHCWGEEQLNCQTLTWRVSLKELLGWIGAYEWFKKGVSIDVLDSKETFRIHPHFGVFAPTRTDYLQLLAHAPLPPCVDVALDIGIGTGVLSAILLKRGVKHIIGTDIQANCIACAHDNLSRLGFDQRFTLLQTDLYPPMQQADLIVCNPPWLPGKARSSLELAVFDQASAMLTGFLSQLKFHLNPNGQAWLIISDLAQRLGLQPEDHLQKLFEQHHIQVLEQHCIQAQHPKSQSSQDPFHLARSAEITSLWRLSLP